MVEVCQGHEACMKIQKPMIANRLCENICYLIEGADMGNDNVTKNYLFPEKVIINFDIFQTLVENRLGERKVALKYSHKSI